MKKIVLLSLGLTINCFSSHIKTQIQWTPIQDGLWLSQTFMPQKSSHADSKVTILKIDPSYFDFNLELATQNKWEKKPINEICDNKKLIAGINAGMFHGLTNNPDWSGLVNTGYTRNFGHINNPDFNKDKDFILFNPRNEKLPRFQILDKSCQSEKLIKEYQSVVQGIRIMDCNKKIVWAKDNKKWSIAIMCTDEDGNCLFVHCRSPYTVHDFMTNLLKLIPNINRAIYLEGGPEASLYVNTPTQKLSLMGSYETNFMENDKNDYLWQIPNIIGIKARMK